MNVIHREISSQDRIKASEILSIVNEMGIETHIPGDHIRKLESIRSGRLLFADVDKIAALVIAHIESRLASEFKCGETLNDLGVQGPWHEQYAENKND